MYHIGKKVDKVHPRLTDQMKPFVLAKDLTAALKHVRCGFELECQAFQGRNYHRMRNEYEEGSRLEIDDNVTMSIILEKWKTHEGTVELFEYFMSANYWDERTFSIFWEICIFLNVTTASRSSPAYYNSRDDFINSDSKPSEFSMFSVEMMAKLKLSGHSMQAIIDGRPSVLGSISVRQMTAILKNVLHSSDSYLNKVGIKPRFKSWHEYVNVISEKPWPQEVHGLVEMVSDGTVSGPEIRTMGGRTVAEALRCLDVIFQNKLTINEKCSFHVHLSIPGVEHTYGVAFQLAAMEYFVENFHQLPSSLRSRMTYREDRCDGCEDDCDECSRDDDDEGESWAGQYFRPNLNTDRYNLVAYRGSTWEFRAFGNTKTKHEAVLCLIHAIRAFHYAYQVKFGYVKPRYKESQWNDGLGGEVRNLLIDGHSRACVEKTLHRLNTIKSPQRKPKKG